MNLMSSERQMPTVVPAIFNYLNQNTTYAVLRNFDGLPYKNRSRDIDILISRQQYESSKKDLAKVIIRAKFKIISFFESERICTFICGKVQGTDVELVQFDFFFHTSAYGVILLSAQEVLDTREFNGDIYHVRKEYEFLDKYLYLKYIGQPYPEKYADIERSMSNNQALDAILQTDFGISNYSVLKELSSREFRKRISSRNRELFCKKHIVNQLLFRYYYLKNMILPKGYSIGFTGPDGVGKTTVIESLTKALNTVYSKISLYHFRPLIIGNLSEVAHDAGLKKNVDRNYNQPHRGGKTNICSSFLRLVYYSFDYIVGYYKVIRRKIERRQIVIFDRYYTDIICDSRRSRIFLNYKFLYWFGKLFIPSLDYNVLLTACSETILARKRELDEEGIRLINKKIDYLSNKKRYKKILNEQSPEVAVSEILNYIFDSQHNKNLRRLK